MSITRWKIIDNNYDRWQQYIHLATGVWTNTAGKIFDLKQNYVLDIATKDRDVAGNTCILAEEYDVGLWVVPDVVLM
jgi:hypothetical protein